MQRVATISDGVEDTTNALTNSFGSYQYHQNQQLGEFMNRSYDVLN